MSHEKERTIYAFYSFYYFPTQFWIVCISDSEKSWMFFSNFLIANSIYRMFVYVLANKDNDLHKKIKVSKMR